MIHPTAIISNSANLAPDVRIGAGCVIGDGVVIGPGTSLDCYVVVHAGTRIGANNRVFSYVSLGDEPQDIKHNSSVSTHLEIGDANIFREFSVVHRGSSSTEGVTRIGNHNFLMNYVHLAHDCQVGSSNIFANGSNLGGQVYVGDFSLFSGMTSIHQFVTIGSYCLLGAGGVVRSNVPSFWLIAGHHSKACGINRIGMLRRGFSRERINNVHRAFRILYRIKPLAERIADMRAECSPGEEIDLILQSLHQLPRPGIIPLQRRK